MNRMRYILTMVLLAAGMVLACQTVRPAGGVTVRLASSVAPETLGDPLRPRVKIETSLGDILLELNVEQAPATVLHFVQYVRKGFYDGTIFHRVKKNSLIQGGGYTRDMAKKAADLPDAFERRWSHALPSKLGSAALVHGAHAGETGTAEFFINVVENRKLDEGPTKERFAVFGQVVDGMETVKRIRNTPVGTHSKYAAGLLAVVPVKPVVINSVRLVTAFDAELVETVARRATRPSAELLAEAIKEFETRYGKKFQTTDSGLQYLDIRIGGGPQPLETDTIEYQYRGTLVDGTVLADTYATRPATDLVSGLIKGMREGLTTMNEGGERILIVPFELAFKSDGIPGHIPAAATLIFRVELLAIN